MARGAALLGALALTACSTSLPSPSRVRNYEFSLEKTAPFRAPYLATFDRQGKTLVFLAADHRSALSFPDVARDPTLRTVEEAFRRLRPQAVVVEGIRARTLRDEEAVAAHVKECRNTAFGPNCGEPWFAVADAIRTGAECAGGEPEDEAILGQIRDQGFTDVDFVALLLAREVPQLRRQRKLSERDLGDWAEKRLEGIHRELPTTAPLTLEGFRSWYALNGKPGGSVTTIENDDVAPVGGTAATRLQRISHAVTVARDRNVVSVVARLLARLDRVLVVYGASHLLSELPAYQHALGEPRYEKLFGGP